MSRQFTVASCQAPDLQNDIASALNTIAKYAQKVDALNAELLCFPECFLQGYIVNSSSSQLAIELNSAAFKTILAKLSPIKTTLIFWLIEQEAEAIFNTAVVIKQGKLLGKYRKTQLLKGEQGVFKAGNSYPIFNLDGLKFGINICYDLNFSECTRAVAEQGAELLVCPSNNMMRRETAEKWKYKHNEGRAERAKEGKLWLLSSDVTGEQKGRISYGPTALINKNGSVVKQLPLMQEGLLVHTLELS